MEALIESLNAAAQIWVERLWSVLWQSTLLAAAVALIAAVFLRRSSPTVRYWVWQILAIKLLLMPFWTYAIPLPALDPSRLIGPATIPAPIANHDAAPMRASRPPIADTLPHADNPLIPADSPALSAASVGPQLAWQGW